MREWVPMGIRNPRSCWSLTVRQFLESGPAQWVALVEELADRMSRGALILVDGVPEEPDTHVTPRSRHSDGGCLNSTKAGSENSIAGL